MSKLTSRSQLRVGDGRQLFRASQLEIGMHIATVSLLEGTQRRDRILRAAVAFSGLLPRNDGVSRLQAGLRGWRFNDVEGLIPHWSGIVAWCNESGVMVELTGKAPDKHDLRELVSIDPAELPPLDTPARLFDTYSAMGLAAVSSSSREYAEEVGRWQQRATLLLDQ